ncbi:sigma-70 family RNA polymerase sigma factor [Stieleria varia]|uniref:RNA polymerase sigma factor RpoE n=1 Tax=Stieleria varia TaxID=2528005 RepID=A0A5C6AX47_9BACT|nr:sigma-70 family RNA polymerase sigma factor [Stieleria varia]TWU04310.1 RNA polymerase sigma factor RpoE [Stieleria varia]
MTVDPTTSVSLLLRLQDSENPRAEEDWNRFVALYTPLFFIWARKWKLQDADASDLVQTVFVKMHRAMPRMRIDPGKRFRGYLFTVVLNAYRDLLSSRKDDPLDGVELENAVQAAESDLQSCDEQEHREYVLGQAFKAMEHLLSKKDWQICQRVFVHGENPQEIADDMGIKVGQVYTATSRAKLKIKNELRGILD